MPVNVLVVDDEPEIADLVEVYLNSEGFTAVKCGTAAQALTALERERIDLALLDIMLPDRSGFELCAEIRKNSQFPILMLTARAEDAEKITGLTIGADDYITKPFNPLELMARIKAQLRRYTRYNEGKAPDGDVLDINGLTVNRATRQCWLYEKEILLTPLEFDILWMLCSHRGQVISAQRLFEEVWHEKYLDRNNTVMVHIRRLREKLGEPSRSPRFIKTVWGVGYRVD
ncbi:MAG: VanR-ABDEGLN family response regulator transcription factor [Oscillospiraceae bacterium]|nr:VanR-ABDEGLN family response regulator transcription factor [Oscillospiraceae bacterium]